MLNGTLYKYGMKGSIKLLLILSAVITLYISVIISMYEPELAAMLDSYVELMPEFMAAVGMTAGATTLIGFMSSYLYGFILILFPMLFCFLRGNALIAKYVDNSSMVSLLAAPVRRRTIAFTQLLVLISGNVLLLLFATVLEIACAAIYFPGELDIGALLVLNAGLFCLHWLIGGICFLASCLFSDAKYSIAVGAGIPILMFVIRMLANMGGKADVAKYFTFFTLFMPDGLIQGEANAIVGAVVLFAVGIVLYLAGVAVFEKKDLHI